MSHNIAEKIEQNKPGESASSQLGREVGDSFRTIESQCITNTTGTFTGFMQCLSGSCRRFLPQNFANANILGVPLQRRHPLMRPTLAIMMISLVLLSVIAFNTDNTYATTSSITVSVSSGGDQVINIPPTKEGKFASSGFTTFNVATTHAAGYTLTANAIALTDGNDTITTLPVGTAITASQFSATDTTSTANYNNKWGYLPSNYCTDSSISSCNDNTTNKYYLPAPISGQTIDITNNNTDKTYTIAIGARLDHTIAQGVYTTTFTLAAVGNPTPYTITYNANAGSDAVTNMPDNHTASDTGANGETINLATNIPVRSNYTFLGWCTTQTNVDANCPTTSYLPNDTYELNQTTTTNTLTLYAMWGNCNSTTNLYNLVACQVKKDSNGIPRTQTLADMQAVITEPTSNNPTTDTSNSGVYLYDADYYGKASDAANTSEIYYFRGILDSAFDSSDDYGGIPSTGNSAYYRNYIRLHDPNSNKTDTCWRIVRTTGSGGVKMIYNGTWTGSTCANHDNNVGINSATYYWNRAFSYDDTIDNCTSLNNYCGTFGFITYVGYNYNSVYAYNNTSAVNPILDNLIFENEKPSNARVQVENWYINTSNLANYELNSELEVSAGWCDDRSTSISPSSSDATKPYYIDGWEAIGARYRNTYPNRTLSLTCPNTTGNDLLIMDDGLEKPISLLTFDESALAGSGYGYNVDPTVATKFSSNYSHNSFLRKNGSGFWLLSPSYRNYGTVAVMLMQGDGVVTEYYVSSIRSLRPTISLAFGITVTGGSGTATNPWVVEP